MAEIARNIAGGRSLVSEEVFLDKTMPKRIDEIAVKVYEF